MDHQIKNLKYLQKEMGISQAEFARALGISKDVYHNYMHGVTKRVSPKVARKVVDIIGNITLEEFVSKDLSKLKKDMVLIIKSDGTPEQEKLLADQKKLIEQQQMMIEMLTKQLQSR